MDRGLLILVRCKVSRGGFPSEKVFRVTQSDGTEHIGAAPTNYFYSSPGKHFPPHKPADRDKWEPGFLLGRVIQESDTVLLVSLPLADVLWVKKEAVTEYPQEARAHVPVQP